jgi:hypothetical protein
MGRFCLEKVNLLVAAGDAADALPISLSCPCHSNPPPLFVCCFMIFAEMGATSTASEQVGSNMFLSQKRVRKNHFGIILVSEICRCCIASHLLLPKSMEMKQDSGGFYDNAAC